MANALNFFQKRPLAGFLHFCCWCLSQASKVKVVKAKVVANNILPLLSLKRTLYDIQTQRTYDFNNVHHNRDFLDIDLGHVHNTRIPYILNLLCVLFS